MPTYNPSSINQLRKLALAEASLDCNMALSILNDKSLEITELVNIAASLRKRYFGQRVQIHIINNVQNGYCQEDCGYCVQRKTKSKNSATIAAYADKSDQEILKEAKQAWQNNAYRYCLVSSGRGLGQKSAMRFAHLTQKIKKQYSLQVCLSAGLIEDPKHATLLAKAGLDRYNHNLNSSPGHYSKICSTHTYQDRIRTLNFARSAGLQLCSGLIVGLGESSQDLVDVAFDLQRQGVVSIPINFFLPVPGHAIASSSASSTLDTDYCLRVLCMFRLLHPKAEIRLAAGRELYLGERQAEGLAIANSLFVSGYLNVRGSPAAQSIAMIKQAGYEIETIQEPDPLLKTSIEKVTSQPKAVSNVGIDLKDKAELRPFEKNKE